MDWQRRRKFNPFISSWLRFLHTQSASRSPPDLFALLAPLREIALEVDGTCHLVTTLQMVRLRTTDPPARPRTPCRPVSLVVRRPVRRSVTTLRVGVGWLAQLNSSTFYFLLRAAAPPREIIPADDVSGSSNGRTDGGQATGIAVRGSVLRGCGFAATPGYRRSRFQRGAARCGAGAPRTQRAELGLRGPGGSAVPGAPRSREQLITAYAAETLRAQGAVPAWPYARAGCCRRCP